jgi:hypothetical protein
MLTLGAYHGLNTFAAGRAGIHSGKRLAFVCYSLVRIFMIAGGRMRRRKVLALLGAALLVPVRSALAEAPGKRSIGALFSQAEGDSEGLARMTAFRQGLATLGWTDAQNIRIDVRWSGGSTDRMQALAADLVGRQPEVILAAATTALVSRYAAAAKWSTAYR